MASTTKQLQDQLVELQGIVDETISILEDAYTVEADRADLAQAIGDALDVLREETEEEEGEDESED